MSSISWARASVTRTSLGGAFRAGTEFACGGDELGVAARRPAIGQPQGAGDLFGARQTGLPAFRFADLEKDFTLLGRARTEARRIVDADPELEAYPMLRRVLVERYGERARMYHVG